MAPRILLTGGAGYIGSHAYVALVAAGCRVTILDDFSNSRKDVPNRLEALTGAPVVVHHADILDAGALRRIFAEQDFNAVVHFAARKAAGESMRIPLDYIRTNCSGLVTLLDAMREAGVFRLVFSSSAAVYGLPSALPIPETAPTGFASTYGVSKLVGEQILERLAASDARWAFGVLRYFNAAGAHGSGLIGENPPGEPNSLMALIGKVAQGELPALTVFGNDYDRPDGTGVRDYIPVEDLAHGHALSLRCLLKTGQSHLVNLGTGRGASVLEVLAAYSAACGRELPYVIGPRRPGDGPAYWADARRAETLLGFRATRGLDEICASSWAWESHCGNQAA
jgi:UDP-glucose 4-epimerase